MRNLRCGSHHFFSILFLSYMGMKQKHSVLTLTFTCFLSLLTLHCHRATATTTICTCPNALHIVYPAALLFTALLSLPHSLPPYICSKIFPVWINSIPNNLRWQSQHTTGIRVGTDVIRGAVAIESSQYRKYFRKSVRAIWQKIYHHSFNSIVIKGPREANKDQQTNPPEFDANEQQKPSMEKPGWKKRQAVLQAWRAKVSVPCPPRVHWSAKAGQRAMFIYKLSMFWLHVDRINIIQDVIATRRPPIAIERYSSDVYSEEWTRLDHNNGEQHEEQQRRQLEGPCRYSTLARRGMEAFK